MKNSAIVLLTIAFVLSLISCDIEKVRPSNTITTVEKVAANFNEIQVASEFEVFLTFSDTQESIQVEANENLQDFIIVENQGDILEIRMRNNLLINGNQTTKVHITTKEIIDFKAAGEAIITLENRLSADKIDIDLAEESQLLGPIQANTIRANLTGEAELNISGQTDQFDLNMAGDSRVRDYAFTCEDLIANLAGESELFLTVMESIKVSATGESVLHYKGTGVVESKELTDEAKIKKED